MSAAYRELLVGLVVRGEISPNEARRRMAENNKRDRPPTAIDIDGQTIPVWRITSVSVESSFYANGSANYLVVKLHDPRETIRREHSRWFDAFAMHDKIKRAMGVC